MKKKDLVRLIGIVVLGGVALLGVLPACSSPVEETQAALAASETTIKSEPAPTTTTSVAVPAATSSNPSDSDILALGKLVFEETAGGVGCSVCHGVEARGGGAGPNIRGTDSFQIKQAVRGGVPAMSFIKLTNEEMKAVIAHIQFISK